MANKRHKEVITLGSGDLMIKEYTGTMPARSTFTDADIIGRIKGGATIEYKPSFYTAKDDSGIVTKTIITEEEATLKSGIMTWNGDVLKKLTPTARVTTASSVRTVKIGGVGNNDNKSYVLCFHHKDNTDGDVWVMIRGVNQAGFTISFVKDSETVIDAEFTCLSQDNEGTLILMEEDTSTVSTT